MKRTMIMAAMTALSMTGVANADVYVHGRNGDRDNPARVADGASGVANTDRRYWTWSCSKGSLQGWSTCLTDVDGKNWDGQAKNYLNWDGVSKVIENANIAVNPLNAHINSKAGTSVIHTHSTGGLIIDRLIFLYGSSKVRWVENASSAGGGSELACIQQPAPVDYNLCVSGARSFSHNSGATHYHYGGSNSNPEMLWLLGSAVSSSQLPGEDDGAVAYHSTLGKATTGTWCDSDSAWYNPASWGCTAWNKGTNYTGHNSYYKAYTDHRYGVSYARGW